MIRNGQKLDDLALGLQHLLLTAGASVSGAFAAKKADEEVFEHGNKLCGMYNIKHDLDGSIDKYLTQALIMGAAMAGILSIEAFPRQGEYSFTPVRNRAATIYSRLFRRAEVDVAAANIQENLLQDVSNDE